MNYINIAFHDLFVYVEIPFIFGNELFILEMLLSLSFDLGLVEICIRLNRNFIFFCELFLFEFVISSLLLKNVLIFELLLLITKLPPLVDKV